MSWTTITAVPADGSITRAKLNSDVFATQAEVRAANINTAAMTPQSHMRRSNELNAETTFTAYNRTANNTVGVGEFKIASGVLTIRPKTDDRTSMLAQLYAGQYF